MPLSYLQGNLRGRLSRGRSRRGCERSIGSCAENYPSPREERKLFNRVSRRARHGGFSSSLAVSASASRYGLFIFAPSFRWNESPGQSRDRRDFISTHFISRARGSLKFIPLTVMSRVYSVKCSKRRLIILHASCREVIKIDCFRFSG